MDKIQRIKALLKEKNITYTEFAKLIGKSKPTVLNYFKGASKIDIDTIEKIAEVLEVDISLLFNESDEQLLILADKAKTLREKLKAKYENLDISHSREQKFFKEQEKLKTYYETIIKERESGMYQFYTLGKAFHTVIDDLLAKKIDVNDINVNKLKALTDRFFAIDVIKLYSMDKKDYDYKDWLKEIIE